jgi:nicotinamidase-related amidase
VIRDRAVLLVHDVVNDFMDAADAALPPVLANLRSLLVAARGAALPVVFAVPGEGTPGADLPASIGTLPGDTIVRKPRWGAFFGSTLQQYLEQTKRDTLIVCGISLAGGVETTVRDAFNRDLRSIVVADACLCRPIPDQGWGNVTSAEVAKVTLSILAQRFARIVTTGQICAELSPQDSSAAR